MMTSRIILSDYEKNNSDNKEDKKLILLILIENGSLTRAKVAKKLDTTHFSRSDIMQSIPYVDPKNHITIDCVAHQLKSAG
jgi:hypothetical protein